nr:hypothetical protein [Tanacetum cinerariifolium]
MVTVRALLAIASINNWSIAQLDINNAFLHGDLTEEIYMKLPPGYTKPHSKTNVCKLQKSLYGLKQANRQWFIKLTTFLIQLGFSQSYADTSFFTFRKDHIFLCLLIYVEDIILTGNDSTYITQIKTQLHKEFCIKDLGLLNVKPSSIPFDPFIKLNHDDPTQYRALVDKLLYLTITRQDISYTAQTLSKFIQAPRTPRLKALVKVLRYLKSCPGQVVSKSSTEAEYRALTDVTCEISWIKCLFKDLGLTISSPTSVYYDNASAIALASNPIQHAKTKHIEIYCNFVRDKIRQGLILLTYIPTQRQLADVLTKGLSKAPYYQCLSK